MSLDAAGFRERLDRHLARWNRDPVFVQRVRIRDLRRMHPDVRALEDDQRRRMISGQQPLPEQQCKQSG